MTIQTPQPEYIDDTQRVVDDALDPAPEEEQIKLVPTTEDWLTAHIDRRGQKQCPVCFSMIPIDLEGSITKHTEWHEVLATVAMLAMQR